jgi:hypothetical protein
LASFSGLEPNSFLDILVGPRQRLSIPKLTTELN